MITMEAWTQWSLEALQDDTQRQRDLGPWQRASAARPGEWPQCATAQRLQPGEPTTDIVNRLDLDLLLGSSWK